MILIVGSNHDDVLYYENLLKNVKEETILNRYHVLIGKIASQDVMVLQDVYTSFVSSMIATYLIDNYLVSLIINVGRCEAISPDLNIGDIALSESVVFGDVDQIAAVKGTTLGQIPNYPRALPISSNILQNMYSSFEKVVDYKFYNATFISSSFFRQNKESVGEILKDEYILSLNKSIVLDGETAGLALASYLTNVPFISVKVVEAKAGLYTSLEEYLSVLNEYASIGKAISTFIGEISRTDVVHIKE